MADLIGCLVVATVWGATNPLIKRGTSGLTDIAAKHPVNARYHEIVYLLTTPAYIIPQTINLSGSILFYVLLGKSDISFVVPVVNSMTFVITFLVSQMLGEQVGSSMKDYLAISLIIAGVALCSA